MLQPKEKREWFIIQKTKMKNATNVKYKKPYELGLASYDLRGKHDL